MIEKLDHYTLQNNPLECFNNIIDKINEIIALINREEQSVIKTHEITSIFSPQDLHDDYEEAIRTIQLNLKAGG